MSIATTLRLKQAFTRSNIQPTTIGRNAQANAVLDAVLLIVSEKAVGQNDRAIASILATALLKDRPYQEHIDQQTQVHVVVRSYVQDPHVGLPMGQRMFRRLFGDRFDQGRVTSTSFAQRRGTSGVIIAQWRAETKSMDGAAQEPHVAHEAAPAPHEVDPSAMAHWSWWAERSLSKERAP
jgi:hypothetical protein